MGLKRERSEDKAEEGPNKLQRGDSNPEAGNGNEPSTRPSSKVRKGTECPYLDTIARQVQLAALLTCRSVKCLPLNVLS